MFYRKLVSLMTALLIVASVLVSTQAKSLADESQKRSRSQVREPLNIAILIQDDLVSQVSNELGVTRDFIRSLPAGSRVMVGYITTGSLQVRQPFTTELEKAANSLRMPLASTAVSPF